MFAKPTRNAIAIHPTKIFIAHSNSDAELARALKFRLEQVDFATLRSAANITGGRPEDRFEVWTYERDSQVGDSLAEIKEPIRNCDIFMIILSRAAAQSEWTQRELGLAVSLREANKADYPRLVAVLASKGAPLSLGIRDFDTGQHTSRQIDFSSQRCFSIKSRHTDFFEDLVGSLTIRTRAFGTNAEDPDEIPDDAFSCYKDLFPIDQERDAEIDIKDWLKEAYLYGYYGAQSWADLFFTMQVGQVCIGMAYVSPHPSSGWIFGNYFAVRGEWRRKLLALRFLRVITAECKKIVPHAKGIIFEVEDYDNCAIISVLKKLSRQRPRLTEFEKSQIHAVRRIARYMGTPLGMRNERMQVALAVTTATFDPIVYFQPAQQAPLGPENEVRLWLMIYPFDTLAVERHDGHIKHQLDIDEVLRFLYDGLYSDAYTGESSTAINGYEEHVKEVKQRVRNAIGNQQVYLTNNYKKLLSKEAKSLFSSYYSRQLRGLGI